MAVGKNPSYNFLFLSFSIGLSQLSRGPSEDSQHGLLYSILFNSRPQTS